jgi:DNA-binding NarL/FixJ family response regulator
VIGEASNGAEFLDLLSHIRPELVIMDIDMPHMNGIEATRKALEMMPGLKIIAYTMFGSDENYNKMTDLGAKGFILKSNDISELENAIHEVMMGESYFSKEPYQKGHDIKRPPSLKEPHPET